MTLKEVVKEDLWLGGLVGNHYLLHELIVMHSNN
jgi:hypothetical protein